MEKGLVTSATKNKVAVSRCPVILPFCFDCVRFGMCERLSPGTRRVGVFCRGSPPPRALDWRRPSSASRTRSPPAPPLLRHTLGNWTEDGWRKRWMHQREREKSPYSGPTWFVNIYLYCSTLYNTTIFSLHDPQVTVKNNTVQATLHPHHSC